ncbi:MAG TPA: gluconate 2-dehydrogenase subunit 3 family protein [Thermodesulfobacteriota bacterium]|nr:gluconate 2-dehydrogenase subunit 3 family protein [Thermodesulfobacteriota bacterium]
MDIENSRRKFLKTLAAGVIGGDVILSAAPLVQAKDNSGTTGFEIHKGFEVFDETTQKNMMKLADAIIPGCESIGMKDKLLQFVKASKGAAGFLDAGLWNVEAVCKTKFKVSFYELKNESDVDLLIKHIRSRNRPFFQSFKKLVIQFYYSDPTVWKKLAYDGPPQPRGFMNYTEMPETSKKSK